MDSFTKQDLKVHLQNVHESILHQKHIVTQQAVRTGYPEVGIDPFMMRDKDGGFVMVPILSAEATVLAALVNLETIPDGPTYLSERAG